MTDRVGGGVDPVPHLADRLTEPADLARSPFYEYAFTLDSLKQRIPMKSERTIEQFDLNRRQRAKQSSLLSLFAPVQICLRFVRCNRVRNPRTRSATSILSQASGFARRQVSAVPSPHRSETSNVDSTAHCRISVGDGTHGQRHAGSRRATSSVSCSLARTCSTARRSNIVVTFPNGDRFAARLDRPRSSATTWPPCDSPPRRRTARRQRRRTNRCPHRLWLRTERPVSAASAAASPARPLPPARRIPRLTIAGAVRPGDSGGGVLNTRGQLVGVVWGQRDGLTYATCGRPLREFLDRVRGKLFGNTMSLRSHQPQSPAPSPQFDWQAWTSEIDARIRALDAKKQDKGDYLQPGDLNGYLQHRRRHEDRRDQFAPRSEIESKLKRLVTQFESVHARRRIGPTACRTDRQRPVSAFLQGLSFGKLAVGALGLSGPLAAAVVIAGGLAGRRLETESSARSQP